MGPRQVLMTRMVWAIVVPQKSRQSEAILFKKEELIIKIDYKRIVA